MEKINENMVFLSLDSKQVVLNQGCLHPQGVVEPNGSSVGSALCQRKLKNRKMDFYLPPLSYKMVFHFRFVARDDD